tara:strand:- start:202 stop:684 length:483 start_codon:yes stop_codon:yes gene_type:complete
MYKSLKKSFYEAVADRYEAFQNFKWEGKLLTIVTDDEGFSIDVETPKDGSMEMDILFFWKDDTGGKAVEQDIEQALHDALKDLSIEIGDRDQSDIYGEIPTGFVTDNPNQDFACDFAMVYATLNGRDRILKTQVELDKGCMEFGVNVLIQIGLDVVVEPI